MISKAVPQEKDADMDKHDHDSFVQNTKRDGACVSSSNLDVANDELRARIWRQRVSTWLRRRTMI